VEDEMIAIVHNTIDLQAVLKSVEDQSAGAIDIFIGTVRGHSRGKKVVALEYDAYQPMALKAMTKIAEEIKFKWGVAKVSIVHRIGRVDVGEASVVIAVSAEHRKEAFDASRYIIDELKKVVPIWKKEFFEDGKIWVDDLGFNLSLNVKKN
jgi:molybdopterin synthase catalytic subunit